MRDQVNDLRLRDHLEGLSKEPTFPGLTWFWGPELYRRNRVVFRELILKQFSDFESGFWGGKRIKWSQHAERLEAWLAAARTNRDIWLVRRLLRWKFAKESWGINSELWTSALIAEYRTAQGPAAQATVLEVYDDWFQLDENSAVELYRLNPKCSKFLLKHLPAKYSFWGGEQRQPWRRLIGLALNAGDEELAFSLYRRQVDAKEWQRDIEQLAVDIQDSGQLHDQLRKRHPEGWGLNRTPGALSLLQLRGRDVMPYIREKLDSILGGWGSQGSTEPVLRLAEARGWWDLWTAVVRTVTDPKIFNRETERLLDDERLDDATRQARLRALAGVSHEWNWAGVGLAFVHSLNDELATKLYARYPELIRGPFKPHVLPRWWQGGPQLLSAAVAAGDEELIDLLASRYVTRSGHASAWDRKEQSKILQTAQELALYYQDLRDGDDAAFARRAGNVLTQVPAFSVFSYDQLLRTNDFARLLFVRSFEAYLSFPAAVRDLIEGSEIHVQMLGYRVLSQDDDRARRLAAETLEILQGTLLRPLHRKTRLAAFAALANAARHDLETAKIVLRRSRDALRLPDTRYPKEELVGLIGQILHRWPELCNPRERPVVYGLTEIGS